VDSRLVLAAACVINLLYSSRRYNLSTQKEEEDGSLLSLGGVGSVGVLVSDGSDRR